MYKKIPTRTFILFCLAAKLLQGMHLFFSGTMFHKLSKLTWCQQLCHLGLFKTLYFSSIFWVEKIRIFKWSGKLFSMHLHVEVVIIYWYRTISCISFKDLNTSRSFADTSNDLKFCTAQLRVNAEILWG